MTTNQTLVYNGVTPAQALTGAQPRELYDYESDNISTFSGSLETKLDYVETRIRLRFEAKDAILHDAALRELLGLAVDPDPPLSAGAALSRQGQSLVSRSLAGPETVLGVFQPVVDVSDPTSRCASWKIR